jgi:hypothetical protein
MTSLPRRYTPPGIIFPVSSVLLERQEEYASRLRGFTGRLLPFVEREPTADKSVRVVNDTADLYRFGDFTELTEFLCRCVVQTIMHDLPDEMDHLARYDAAKARIQDFLEMPDAMISSLVNFILQHDGVLSKKRRREFEKMRMLRLPFEEPASADDCGVRAGPQRSDPSCKLVEELPDVARRHGLVREERRHQIVGPTAGEAGRPAKRLAQRPPTYRRSRSATRRRRERAQCHRVRGPAVTVNGSDPEAGHGRRPENCEVFRNVRFLLCAAAPCLLRLSPNSFHHLCLWFFGRRTLP